MQSQLEFLVQRFDSDKHMIEALVPFLNPQEDADIKAVHQLIYPDLDPEELGMEYQDFVFWTRKRLNSQQAAQVADV